jgi:hypothetical protein
MRDMTRPKRVFAEMLAAAQGGDIDVDDICDRLSLADIMYELKKLEKEAEAEAEEAKAAVAAAEAEAVADVAAKKKKPVVDEPHKIEDFWTRISGE